MPKYAPLARSFFRRAPEEVAAGLIGQLLCRQTPAGISAARIVEVEAYLGARDAAAHAYRGKTARNAVLFGPPGFAYVYFIYGRYFCLNVSCQPEGEAGCVLFRAVEPVAGLEWLRSQRAVSAGLAAESLPENFACGPSRLCQSFGLTRELHNGLDLTRQDSGLWLAAGPGLARDEALVIGTRIGIKENVEARLRYFIDRHLHVSPPRKISA